jgi:hypothetical protein
MAVKINEHALRWVLNMRQAMKRLDMQMQQMQQPNKSFQMYHPVSWDNTSLKDINTYKTELNKLVAEDGHSGATFAWTYAQAHHIEEHGLETWLTSPAAKL